MSLFPNLWGEICFAKTPFLGTDLRQLVHSTRQQHPLPGPGRSEQRGRSIHRPPCASAQGGLDGIRGGVRWGLSGPLRATPRKNSAPGGVVPCPSFGHKRVTQSFYAEKGKEWNVVLSSLR